MVFQHFNLFPNLTIHKNITLAPVNTGRLTAKEASAKADMLLSGKSRANREKPSIPDSKPEAKKGALLLSDLLTLIQRKPRASIMQQVTKIKAGCTKAEGE